MQAVVGRQEAKRRASAIAAAKQEDGSSLSMYVEPPSEDISIEDFEAFALDRLAVLKGTEDALARGMRGDKLEELTTELLAKYNLQLVDPTSYKLNTEAVRKDTLSHFILRLAYCRTEELRRWYLTQECAIFRHRFSQLLTSQRAQFLHENNLRYEQVSSKEFDDIGTPLYNTVLSQANAEVAKQQTEMGAAGFYKVPFEDVPELVKTRKVFLQGGFAYVPSEQLSVLVTGAFRAGLSKALTLTARRWATTTSLEEADRLTPVVEALSTQYLGSDYSNSTGGQGLSLADLGAAMDQSAPLCMRNLFVHLKEEHHLRHNGRMQLGLFLKGVGLSLEDALLFWRTEFCRKITPEQFEKQYSYNVRHNYGKEGKRQDYTPYSCMKVCSATPGAGEHHGCPYRTFSEDSLRAALRGLKVGSGAIEGIVEKAKNKHYQLACADTFAARFGKELDEGVQHPNQYFRESRKALGFDTQATEDAVPVTPGVAPGAGTEAAAVVAN